MALCCCPSLSPCPGMYRALTSYFLAAKPKPHKIHALISSSPCGIHLSQFTTSSQLQPQNSLTILCWDTMTLAHVSLVLARQHRPPCFFLPVRH